jgi:hypothetical protein
MDGMVGLVRAEWDFTKKPARADGLHETGGNTVKNIFDVLKF